MRNTDPDSEDAAFLGVSDGADPDVSDLEILRRHRNVLNATG
ncbi:hypothetical protein ABZ642_20720 [Streptomyces sp. NPDC007157]